MRLAPTFRLVKERKIWLRLNAFANGNLTPPENLGLIGIYELVGTAAVTYYRFILEPDGTFLKENWVDLGGWWNERMRGTFRIDGDQIHLVSAKATDRDTPLALVRLPDTGQIALLPPGRQITESGRDVFWKQAFPTVIQCIALKHADHDFSNSLTLGKNYIAVSADAQAGRILLLNDQLRTRIYPTTIFKTY